MFAVSVCCPRELIVVGRSTCGLLCGTTCHCSLFPMNIKLLSKTAKVCLSSSLLEEETVNYRSNCSDCVNVHASKAVITTVIMSIRTINGAGERKMEREENRKRNGRSEGAMQEDGDKFMSEGDAAKMSKRSQHDTTHESREYPHPVSNQVNEFIQSISHCPPNSRWGLAVKLFVMTQIDLVDPPLKKNFFKVQRKARM